MLAAVYFKLVEVAERLQAEERGDSLVNWLVLALGLAAAAAVVIAILGPAIQSAAQRIVNTIGG
jgi:hypothetical protein